MEARPGAESPSMFTQILHSLSELKTKKHKSWELLGNPQTPKPKRKTAVGENGEEIAPADGSRNADETWV